MKIFHSLVGAGVLLASVVFSGSVGAIELKKCGDGLDCSNHGAVLEYLQSVLKHLQDTGNPNATGCGGAVDTVKSFQAGSWPGAGIATPMVRTCNLAVTKK